MNFLLRKLTFPGWMRIVCMAGTGNAHLYEVPFYYIEYGIAQLGAIGLWKQFKQNPENAVTNYVNALRLGGTKTLPNYSKTRWVYNSISPRKP